MPAATETPQLAGLLICDDVRLEVDGRYSLMGVYPGATVTVHQLPTIISQLAFCFRFAGLPSSATADFVFRAPDGHEARPSSAKLLESESSTTDAMFVVHASPLQVSQAGWHSIFIRIGPTILESGFRIEQPR